jgi:hypothetical protein
MSKKRRDPLDRLRGPFVPLYHETLLSPAYKQLSMGARALLTALKRRCFKNNSHVYLSLRDAAEELGHHNRNDLSNWFRELVHYGFIVMTEAASLGVDGKGKAPHWRITDMPTRAAGGGANLATKEFLKWDGTVFERHVAPSSRWSPAKKAALKKQNPGLHVRTTVDSTLVPEVDSTSVPRGPGSGTDGESISADLGGTDGESISSLATRKLSLVRPEAGETER